MRKRGQWTTEGGLQQRELRLNAVLVVMNAGASAGR